jgi:hypothetical protein
LVAKTVEGRGLPLEVNRNLKASSWIWPALCVGLSIVLFYVVYENVQLKQEIAGRTVRQSTVQDGAVTGDPAYSIKGYTGTDHLITLVEDTLSQPLVLGWFSDACDGCYFAREGWEQLAAAFPEQFWAIRKDAGPEPDSLFYGYSVLFPILAPTDETIAEQYRVLGTPQTMVILPDRTIGQVWKGALTPDIVNDILEYIHTR